MIKKIKNMFWKHWNCIPWFVVGIDILLGDKISKWQFAACWVCILLFVWKWFPTDGDDK